MAFDGDSEAFRQVVRKKCEKKSEFSLPIVERMSNFAALKMERGLVNLL